MERSEINRVSAAEASRRVQAGQAMLVCAYEADEKFRSLALEGAMPFSRFLGLLPQVDMDQEVIFYCA